MKILIYRIGQLGDTVIALPSLWAIRRHYKDAHLTLLCERRRGTNGILAVELLQGAGVCDDFLSYMPQEGPGGRLLFLARMLKLAARLRRMRFGAVVYLAPSLRAARQVARDRWFFSLASIRKCLGMTGFPELPKKSGGGPLLATESEADLLLRRLARDGIPVPPPGCGSLELCLGARECEEVEAWERTLSGDGNKPWIGIAPGSKMAAKRWPLERFEQVVQMLIDHYDVWPVVFGNREEHSQGIRLTRAWGRGHVAAGALTVRGAVHALRKCRMYLGNDTGTMHLAAAAGTPCVGIFSARDFPGRWNPYGRDHVVLRTRIDCEGCLLEVCRERGNACLDAITADQVWRRCQRVMHAINNCESQPYACPSEYD